jgi:BT_3987-like, N-terminal domain
MRKEQLITRWIKYGGCNRKYLNFKLKIMKIKLNKWIGLLAGIVLLGNLSSCIKDKGFANETDFSQLQDHVLLVNGGPVGFSASNIAFQGDTATATVTVDLASVNLPASPVSVTIAVDNAQIAIYNAANGKDFQPMADSDFSLAATTLTIPAGQQYASTTVSFYAAGLDPGLSYMLPISITDASGKLLSSNQNTQYFNIIGNPLAGNYSDVGYLYHPSAPRDIPADFKTITAITSTTLQVDLGDLGGAGYIAWFEVDPNTNHVTVFDPPGYYNATDDFLVQFDSGLPSSNPGYTAAWSGSAQCNNTYDPATKTFYLRYGYLGGTGWRVTEEILVKQ